MKAVQYKVENCLLDNENKIHIIFIDDEYSHFIPLLLPFKKGSILIPFEEKKVNSDNRDIVVFLLDSWAKLCYEIGSLIIDCKDDSYYFVSTITFKQNQFSEKYIYITTQIPVPLAVIISYLKNIPIFITARSERLAMKIPIDKLENYCKKIKGE